MGVNRFSPGCGCCPEPCPNGIVDCGSGDQRIANVTFIVDPPDEIIWWQYDSSSGLYFKYTTTGWSAFAGTFVYTFDHDNCVFNYIDNPVTIDVATEKWNIVNDCPDSLNSTLDPTTWSTNILIPQSSSDGPKTHRFKIGTSENVMTGGIPAVVDYLKDGDGFGVDQCEVSNLIAEPDGTNFFGADCPEDPNYSFSGTAETILE